MKVATALYSLNYVGGIERASYEVATRIAASGVEMDVYSHLADPAPDPPISWRRVDVALRTPALLPLVFSSAATKAIDPRAYDVVHNQGGCALRRQDVVTAHSCHRAWWEIKKQQGQHLRAHLNPLHRAILHVERANYAPGAFEHVIVVSAGVQRELARYYDVPGERVTVIPNGVDVDLFQPADRARTRARVRQERGFTDEDVVLLFVGKEFRRKGLGPVIEALAQLPQQVRLLVVGGDRQAPFRELAAQHGVSDRVVFVGHTTAVQDFFQAADVFVFPTLYEAFALVTLEAAAAGLPLVVTKVNGTEDFVEDGVNGRFVEREAAAIASALRPMVDHPRHRQRMGENALRLVQEYTWDAVARRTLDVYRHVAEVKSASARRAR